MLAGYRGKRTLDLVLALTLLVLLSPVFLVISIFLGMLMGAPIFFRQERPGLNTLPFVMYKFRTMKNAFDEKNRPLPDDQRLTKIGRFLRQTSLDELPELFNVIRGEMSLVGPRPLLTRYLPYYTDREHLRHSLRPGVTGWAQLNGRNRLSWTERLSADVWYVENCSLKVDLKILLLTVFRVVKQDGVIVSPQSAMLDLDKERSIKK